MLEEQFAIDRSFSFILHAKYVSVAMITLLKPNINKGVSASPLKGKREKGKKSKKRQEHEDQHWFKDIQRFRAGGEAKINLLKRKYGLNRSHEYVVVGGWLVERRLRTLSIVAFPVSVFFKTVS